MRNVRFRTWFVVGWQIPSNADLIPCVLTYCVKQHPVMQQSYEWPWHSLSPMQGCGNTVHYHHMIVWKLSCEFRSALTNLFIALRSHICHMLVVLMMSRCWFRWISISPFRSKTNIPYNDARDLWCMHVSASIRQQLTSQWRHNDRWRLKSPASRLFT